MQLVIISPAPPEIVKDIIRAPETGEEAYKRFRSEWLDTNKTQFHDKIPCNKLKTFSSRSKQKSVKSRGRTVILKADKALFGRIILHAQQLHMAEVLCHPLGPIP